MQQVSLVFSARSLFLSLEILSLRFLTERFSLRLVEHLMSSREEPVQVFFLLQSKRAALYPQYRHEVCRRAVCLSAAQLCARVALCREVLSTRAAAGRSKCSFHAVRFAYGAAVQVLYLLLFTLCDLHKSNANWTE